MSQVLGANLAISSARQARGDGTGAPFFVIACVFVILCAALLAGSVPIGFSIVTVFLFAGPHNWVEFRYFLSKMPAHWGPLRGFFLLAIGGVLGLTALFAAIPFIGEAAKWSTTTWGMASATWNSLLLLWLAALVMLRGR